MQWSQERISPTLTPRVIIDGVAFQFGLLGIGRVWLSLLKQWASDGSAQNFLILDRNGTAPRVGGLTYRRHPAHGYDRLETDILGLQQVCDEERADVFISTYYSYPRTTPSVFLAYDMIPELGGWDLGTPMWREKDLAIQKAALYVAISGRTALDLNHFYPRISPDRILIAHPGVGPAFHPASGEEIIRLRSRYGIRRPYFLMVGHRLGYKNQILFFQAISRRSSLSDLALVCVGSTSELEEEFKYLSPGLEVHMLRLTDDELRAAYSGAIALSFPSMYEGFGLPALEAMACGSPVITCPRGPIPEVVGEAALWVRPDDPRDMAQALDEVRKPEVRRRAIALGLAQSKKFSWARTASVLMTALHRAGNLD